MWTFISDPWISSAQKLMRIELSRTFRSAPDISAGREAVWLTTFVEADRVRRAALRVAAIADGSPYATSWPHARALLLLQLPVPDQSEGEWFSRAAGKYQLSGAETRVLRRLVGGATPLDVSKDMGLTYHTVRSHLQSIFAKTNCHRQSELVRLFGRR